MKEAAVIAKPLTELISLPRKTIVDWSIVRLADSFNKLKNLALENTSLSFPDYNNGKKLV